MFTDLEKSVHKRVSPFFHIFDEFEFSEEGHDRYLMYFNYEINIAPRRSKTSPHISLVEFFISDISESGKRLKFIGFGIFWSEIIFRTIDEDSITSF